MKTIDETLDRVLNPYWCKTPQACSWTDTKGPAGFLTVNDDQNFPNVGLFNLCWLMLDTDYAKKRTANDKVVIETVIFKIQHFTITLPKMEGLCPLGNIAAMSTLPVFYKLIQYHLLPLGIAAMCRSKLGATHESS